MALHDLLAVSRRAWGEDRAVVADTRSLFVSSADLDRLSDRVRDRLAAWGVGRGDRVGVYLRKSADAVAVIFGILKAGAAYVPVDPGALAVQNACIHDSCCVRAVVIERRFEGAYREELGRLRRVPRTLVLAGVGGGAPLDAALDAADTISPAREVATADSCPNDLACILYTSGSTGKSQGVMLSHRNAASFVDWCSSVLAPGPADLFSWHALFHFDRSLFDLYVSRQQGTALAMVPEEASPRRRFASGVATVADGPRLAAAERQQAQRRRRILEGHVPSGGQETRGTFGAHRPGRLR